MKIILFLFFSFVFYFRSSAQFDTTKTHSAISNHNSNVLGFDLFRLGKCYETIRYLRKNGTIKKEILDDKNGRRMYIIYKKGEKKVEVKYHDKWAMSFCNCGKIIVLKD